MTVRRPSGVEVSFELTTLGMDLLAQRFRREHPDASPDEVDAHVLAWLHDRPGAPDGDAVGRPVPFPRHT